MAVDWTARQAAVIRAVWAAGPVDRRELVRLTGLSYRVVKPLLRTMTSRGMLAESEGRLGEGPRLGAWLEARGRLRGLVDGAGDA